MRLATFIAFLPVLAACSGGISTPPTGSSGDTSGSSTSSGGSEHRTFLSGTGLACEVDTQLCNAATGFPTETNTSYSCDPIPTACITDHTCMCLEQNGGGGFIVCTVGSDGSISVSTDLP
jgi:hypothetical protein